MENHFGNFLKLIGRQDGKPFLKTISDWRKTFKIFRRKTKLTENFFKLIGQQKTISGRRKTIDTSDQGKTISDWQETFLNY